MVVQSYQITYFYKTLIQRNNRIVRLKILLENENILIKNIEIGYFFVVAVLEDESPRDQDVSPNYKTYMTFHDI